MQVNKTEAAKLAGVSRRQFYNHIPVKKISVIKDDDGNESIDLSELERVYGTSKIRKNRKLLEDAQKDVGNDVNLTQNYTRNNTNQEINLLKEKILNLESINKEIRETKEREREQFTSEIENLRTIVSKAQDNFKLLTDQRDKQPEIEALRDSIQQITKQNRQIVEKLRDQQAINETLQKKLEKGFWDRFLGR